MGVPINKPSIGAFASAPQRATVGIAGTDPTAGIGNTINKIGDYVADLKDADDYANAQLEFDKATFSLQEKYKEDYEVGTLQSRYDSELDTAVDGIIGGTSGRVGRQLRRQFAQAKQDSKQSFAGTVEKKDNALRVERFTQNIDGVENSIVFADSAQERETAWKKHQMAFAAIKPRMSPDAWEKLIDASRDNINYQIGFRGLPQMVANNEAFNPKTFKDLDVNQTRSLEKEYNRLTKSRDAHSEAFIGNAVKDELDSRRLTGQVTRDVVSELKAMGKTEKAAQVQAQSDIALKSFQTETELTKSTLSFGEQKQVVAAEFKLEAGERAIGAKASEANSIMQSIAQRESKFRKDPKQFVDESLPTPQGLEGEEAVEWNLKMQLEYGKRTTEWTPSILSKTQVSSFKDAWDSTRTDATQRRAMLMQVKQGYGKYTNKVLQEVGLGMGEMIGVEALTNPNAVQYSRIWIQAGDVKESDIQMEKTEKDALKEDTRKILNDSGTIAEMDNIIKLQPYNLGLIKQINEIKQRAYKASLLTGDADYGRKMVTSLYQPLGRSDVGAIILPAEANSLEKNNIAQNLINRRAKISSDTLYKGIGESEAFFEERAKDIKRRGMWTNAPSKIEAELGEGFVLLDNTTGLPVEDKDKKPIFISINEARNQPERPYIRGFDYEIQKELPY